MAKKPTKPTKAQIQTIKKWINQPAKKRPEAVKKLFQKFRPWIRANLVKKDKPSGSVLEQYAEQVLALQDLLSKNMDPRFESIVNSLMSSLGPGSSGFELPPPPSLSLPSGGVSVPNLIGSNYPQSVADAQFGAAIADINRRLDLARAQAQSNVQQISDWFTQPITRQEQAIAANQEAFQQAGEELEAAAEGVLAATGAEADPALAQALGAFAIASRGNLEATQASQQAFDQAMVPALLGQRNDAIMAENRLQAQIQRDLQFELGQLERQKASTAAQIAGELAIRQAEMQFQAAQAAADRAAQMAIAQAEIQSQWAQLAAQLQENRFAQQLSLAGLLAETGRDQIGLADLVQMASAAFDLDSAAQLLALQIQDAKANLDLTKANIGLTEAQTDRTKAETQQIKEQIKIAQAEMVQELKDKRKGPIPNFNKLTPKDLVDLGNLLKSRVLNQENRLTMHPLTAWTAMGNALRTYSNGKWDPKKNPKVNRFRNQIMQEIFNGRSVRINFNGKEIRVRNAVNWNGVIWQFKNGKPTMVYQLRKGKWVRLKKKK